MLVAPSASLPQRSQILFICLLSLSNITCTPTLSPHPAPDQTQTTLDQVVFRRSDSKGQPLWELQANSVVISDQHVTYLSQIDGTIYQNNQATYHFQARWGQIHQQSTHIHLHGSIFIQDTRNHSTLQSQKVQWHPPTGKLTAQAGVIFNHPQFTIHSQDLQASTQSNQVQMGGQVTLKLPNQGWQLQAHQMTWLPYQKSIQATSSAGIPVQLSQIPKNNPPSIPGQQAQAQHIKLNLPAQQLILEEAVEVTLTQPQIQFNSPRMVVDLTTQTWHNSQGIRIRYQDIIATAHQGWFQPSQKLQLHNQVDIQGLPHRAHLKTQTLTWDFLTHGIKAQGHVVYQQNTPWMEMTGTRATGNLRERTFELFGGTTLAEVLP